MTGSGALQPREMKGVSTSTFMVSPCETFAEIWYSYVVHFLIVELL